MTISQNLSRLPGVNQLQTGVGISKPVIRGMSGTRILVSDLGLKQEGQQWGSDHGLELDPFGAEKIEVIKGPSTLLYGSDALGGVIRIQTPSIPEEGLSGENATLFRSNNNYIGNSLSINGKKGKWFGKARATWSEYGDYKVPAKSFTYLNRTLPIENERLKNTSGRDFHYQITGGYAGERGVTKLTWSHFHQRNGLFPGIVGIPTGSNVADDGDRRNVDLPQQNVDHYKLAVNSSINLSEGWLQFDAGVQRNERQELIQPHREGYAPLPDSPIAHLAPASKQKQPLWRRLQNPGRRCRQINPRHFYQKTRRPKNNLAN
jgi:iron complex outermembrane receptor protein